MIRAFTLILDPVSSTGSNFEFSPPYGYFWRVHKIVVQVNTPVSPSGQIQLNVLNGENNYAPFALIAPASASTTLYYVWSPMQAYGSLGANAIETMRSPLVIYPYGAFAVSNAFGSSNNIEWFITLEIEELVL